MSFHPQINVLKVVAFALLFSAVTTIAYLQTPHARGGAWLLLFFPAVLLGTLLSGSVKAGHSGLLWRFFSAALFALPPSLLMSALVLSGSTTVPRVILVGCFATAGYALVESLWKIPSINVTNNRIDT